LSDFHSLGLSPEVLRALDDLGFESPSPIQAQAIPSLLSDAHDLIGLAQTGTGKTAAFGLPLLERIDPEFPHTQALILAPTRELGQQIAEQIDLFSKYLPKLNVLAVYGGAAISNQIKALHKPQHIIIATPGRLIDLIGRRAVKLDHLEILVLDEADEMLNMGFKEALDEILTYTPKDKMTWLFSATMPREIRRIVDEYMHKPIEVKVNQEQTLNKNIEHQFVSLNHNQKSAALKRFIDLDPDIRAVVFCRTKLDTQNLAEELMHEGYQADALHGDLSQAQRDRVMKRFKEHKLPILIATDVAARGIDVNDLSHVFHFALPDDAAYYTHRSGRTARAGKKGISLVFVGQRDFSKLKYLQSRLGIEFERVRIPDAKDIAFTRMDQWGQKVVDQKVMGVIPDHIIDHLEGLFAQLSQEELLGKIVAMEMEKIQVENQEDLNVSKSQKSKKGKGGKGGYNKSGNNGGPSFKAKRKPGSFKHGHKRKPAKRKRRD